jgi:hypothetical protein
MKHTTGLSLEQPLRKNKGKGRKIPISDGLRWVSPLKSILQADI